MVALQYLRSRAWRSHVFSARKPPLCPDMVTVARNASAGWVATSSGLEKASRRLSGAVLGYREVGWSAALAQTRQFVSDTGPGEPVIALIYVPYIITINID